MNANGPAVTPARPRKVVQPGGASGPRNAPGPVWGVGQRGSRRSTGQPWGSPWAWDPNLDSVSFGGAVHPLLPPVRVVVPSRLSLELAELLPGVAVGVGSRQRRWSRIGASHSLRVWSSPPEAMREPSGL